MMSTGEHRMKKNNFAAINMLIARSMSENVFVTFRWVEILNSLFSPAHYLHTHIVIYRFVSCVPLRFTDSIIIALHNAQIAFQHLMNHNV
jgi:hypothetical protein